VRAQGEKVAGDLGEKLSAGEERERGKIALASGDGGSEG
jgi:hypothetical protein